jgi:hypothetical protein
MSYERGNLLVGMIMLTVPLSKASQKDPAFSRPDAIFPVTRTQELTG